MLFDRGSRYVISGQCSNAPVKWRGSGVFRERQAELADDLNNTWKSTDNGRKSVEKTA